MCHLDLNASGFNPWKYTKSTSELQMKIYFNLTLTNVIDQRPNTNATFVTAIVSPTSVSTAISDAAIIEKTGQPGCTSMIKLDRRRLYIYKRHSRTFPSCPTVVLHHVSRILNDPVFKACAVMDSDRSVHIHYTAFMKKNLDERI